MENRVDLEKRKEQRCAQKRVGEISVEECGEKLDACNQSLGILASDILIRQFLYAFLTVHSTLHCR